MADEDPLNPPEVEALFPEGVSPENRLPTISSLCSYGTRPLAMTGFFRQLLLDHYVDPKHIEDPKLRYRLEEVGAWKPGPQGTVESGIVIESITHWKPETAMQRQSLVIKRNAWQWDRVLPGDSDGDDHVTGHQYYRGFWRGSHTVFAVAGTGAEAETLAFETQRFFLHFGPLIVEQMNLHRFVPVGMDALHKVEEVAEHYVVPVTVAYAAEEMWRIEPYAPRLKRISFKASDLF